uniref:Hexosyltransferase n=1 Tax=Pseudo-nitzschia multistriata TaxID=183589 RepID=A0A448ZRH7_9STRA
MCTNSECDSSAWKMAPYQNFVHLTGRSKPWYKNRTSLEEGINSKKNHTSFKRYSNEEYWYWLLKNALQETGFHDRVSLDFITQEKRESAVGSTPSFDQRAQYIRRKAKNGWRQYEYEERDFNEGNYDERLLTLANSGRETGRRAQDLVASLESFQPQTALRPYLIRLEAIKNNLMTQAMPQISPGEEETALDSTSANEAADTRKWAYAFLLGGARSNTTETEYLGGFYSVVVAVYQLRKLGSRADFVLMVQIAAESPHHKLSGFEQDILQKMNIKVIYIPKFANGKLECFYSLMMEKFRILNLTEYSRVMYLDYDVLPTCNLDYLFDLSDPLPRLPGRGSNMMDQTSDATFRLKENVILAYQSEPSAGGIFILKPDASDFNQIQRIIYEKEVRSSKQPYPHWDPMFGWGHVITKPDSWKDMRGRTGSNWTWYGAEADQGLLYYWTKYVKKSVSIISKHNIEQWDSNYWDTDSKGTLFLRQNETNMPEIAKKPLENYGCPVEGFLPAPYNDFFHLTGRAKPWFLEREQLENPDCFNNNNERECKMQAKWYRLLNEAMVSIKIPDGFSLDFLGTKKLAPVGHAPNDKQISEYLAVKKNRHWNQYEDLKIEQ